MTAQATIQRSQVALAMTHAVHFAQVGPHGEGLTDAHQREILATASTIRAQCRTIHEREFAALCARIGGGPGIAQVTP